MLPLVGAYCQHSEKSSFPSTISTEEANALARRDGELHVSIANHCLIVSLD